MFAAGVYYGGLVGWWVCSKTAACPPGSEKGHGVTVQDSTRGGRLLVPPASLGHSLQGSRHAFTSISDYPYLYTGLSTFLCVETYLPTYLSEYTHLLTYVILCVLMNIHTHTLSVYVHKIS